MSNSLQNDDGRADAIAATAIIAIVVFGLYLWLAGMPG
ncbi:methionine synthase [Kineobactrum salinum]|nr:methionine synthase [Kineobactrum salinum]